MTEFQFIEDLESYQKSFEKLNYIFIRDMHKYIRKSKVYDSKFFNTVLNYSVNITLTASWIKLLKNFNSDKYTNILRFSPNFNNLNGVPDAIKKSVGQQQFKMTIYSNDPRMITAKFSSNCSKCKTRISKGTEIYYWPSSHEVFCLACGEESYRQFRSDAADEDVMNGCGNPLYG